MSIRFFLFMFVVRHRINRILLLDQCNLREIKAKEELIPFGFF